MGSSSGDASFNPDADLSGMDGGPDGTVDGLDLDQLTSFFGCDADEPNPAFDGRFTGPVTLTTPSGPVPQAP